jgi:outer membrane protein TolC
MSKLLFLLFLLSTNTWSSNKFLLTEEELIKLSLSENPTLASIEANFTAIKQKLLTEQTDYTTRLNLGADYLETRQQALFAFAPVFSPVRTIYSSLQKNTRSGVQAGLTLANDQRSATNGMLNRANTSSIDLSFSIDLWKNFFGALSKARNRSINYEHLKASLEKEISIKTYQLALRKIYWAIVANTESIKISTELYQAALKQESDAKSRYRSSVADLSEVARYESQVAARKSSLLYLEYQRESLIKQLKELLPVTLDKEIELDQYDLSNTIVKVLECTRLIGDSNKAPLDFTKYDEIVVLLKKIQAETEFLARSTSMGDVKLVAGYNIVGVDSPSSGSGSFSGSTRDFREHDRSGFNIGLMYSKPLGDDFDKLASTEQLVINKRYEAEITKFMAQIDATHDQLKRSINILTEVIKNQKINSAKLKIRLSEMQKKYQQARISVNDLINDQDALLNSDLSVVQTQLEVVNILFDYLVVFSETPCSFNRMQL